MKLKIEDSRQASERPGAAVPQRWERQLGGSLALAGSGTAVERAGCEWRGCPRCTSARIEGCSSDFEFSNFEKGNDSQASTRTHRDFYC